jgi:hypothetical protein
VKSGTPDEQLLIRYLLGELKEDECIEFEQLCLESDELFEELEAVEAELTDDYVRGILVGRRRKEFEKRLLNIPGRAEQIQFAKLVARCPRKRRTLIDGVKAWIESSGLGTRLVQTSIAAAALALIVAVGLFSLRNWPPKSDTRQISHRGSPATNAETWRKGPTQAQAPSQSSGSAPVTPPTERNVPLIAIFSLTAGSTRGEGESNEIKIPREAKRVRFRIELPSNDHKTYGVSLNRVEGERVFRQDNLKPRPSKAGDILTIEMPANVLSPGTSVLSVMGIGTNGAPEDVGKYVIRAHAQ